MIMTLIISLERRVLYKDIIGKHSNFTAIKIYDFFSFLNTHVIVINDLFIKYHI